MLTERDKKLIEQLYDCLAYKPLESDFQINEFSSTLNKLCDETLDEETRHWTRIKAESLISNVRELPDLRQFGKGRR